MPRRGSADLVAITMRFVTSTSYVNLRSLKIRLRQRCIERLTDAFDKKMDGHIAATAL
jgi:hypothetical protein